MVSRGLSASCNTYAMEKEPALRSLKRTYPPHGQIHSHRSVHTDTVAAHHKCARRLTQQRLLHVLFCNEAKQVAVEEKRQHMLCVADLVRRLAVPLPELAKRIERNLRAVAEECAVKISKFNLTKYALQLRERLA